MVYSSLVITALLLIAFPGFMLAQEVADTVILPPPFPTDPGEVTIEFLLTWTNALYGALVLISGYFANKIPFLKTLPNTAWRVAAIALAIAMAFLVAGKGLGLGFLVSFLAASNFYALVMSLFKKTPKSDEPLLPKK